MSKAGTGSGEGSSVSAARAAARGEISGAASEAEGFFTGTLHQEIVSDRDILAQKKFK
jgi:hypothetical protein